MQSISSAQARRFPTRQGKSLLPGSVTVFALALLGFLAVTPVHAACVGDCNGDAVVSVDEIIRAVGIALGDQPVDACAAADTDASGDITVDEILAALNVALEGCPASSMTDTPTQIGTATAAPSATATATATATSAPDEPVPTGTALRAWLAERRYADWAAESAPHDSLGPHFGRVRTFVNDALLESLNAANDEHPQGAAVVKELYGSSDEVRGWSVMIKQAPTSAGGANWYWLEVFGSSVFADGPGARLCTGCHASDYRGLISRDLVLTPFPLQ